MYVVWTYPWINPYMKGLHLTIDSWRPFRGPDGFKLRGKELERALAWGVDGDMPCRRTTEDSEEAQAPVSLMALHASSGEEPPLDVTPVPRFIDDLAYLTQLTEVEGPPRQLYRSK